MEKSQELSFKKTWNKIVYKFYGEKINLVSHVSKKYRALKPLLKLPLLFCISDAI